MVGSPPPIKVTELSMRLFFHYQKGDFICGSAALSSVGLRLSPAQGWPESRAWGPSCPARHLLASPVALDGRLGDPRGTELSAAGSPPGSGTAVPHCRVRDPRPSTDSPPARLPGAASS